MTLRTAKGVAGAPRSEGLETLRAVAAILVVMLHAAMPYLGQPMPGLIWPVRDVSSRSVDALCWAIEGFIMPLFLLQAGLFAAGLLKRNGPSEFLRHRARRLLAPMALACLFVIPADFFVWTLGLQIDGRATWQQFRRMKFDPVIQKQLFGFSHLWFLQYLFLLCAGLTLWHLWRSMRRRDRVEKPAGSGVPGALAVALASVTAVLWWEPNIVVGFQHSFLPALPKFVHAAMFFSLGVWLHGDERRSRDVVRWSRPLLLAASVAFVLMLPAIHAQQSEPLAGPSRAELAFLMAVYAIGMSLGLFGLFLGSVDRAPGWLKPVAEASFWIYLVHHPLVGLIQIDLARWSIPPEAKFLTVTALTVALAVSSHHWVVRYTKLGALMNGRRVERGGKHETAASPPDRREAAPHSSAAA